MFGDILQEVFKAIEFLRARLSTSSGPQTEFAFLLGKARVVSTKMMTFKAGIIGCITGRSIEQDICRALTMNVKRVFMWTDSTTVLPCLNSTIKHTTFFQSVYARP